MIAPLLVGGGALLVALWAATRGARAEPAPDRRERRERERPAPDRSKRRERERPAPDRSKRRERERPAAPSERKGHAVELDERDARRAAESLYTYIVTEVRAGRSRGLGSRDRPNDSVSDAQAAMGGIAIDGIYGPDTRARGKQLTGRDFPARRSARPARPARPAQVRTERDALAPPAPVEAPREAPPAPVEAPPAPVEAPVRGAVQAARDLYAHARDLIDRGRGALLGTRTAPSALVLAAQSDMGRLVADGIYGPSTRARGKELTGQTFPARV